MSSAGSIRQVGRLQVVPSSPLHTQLQLAPKVDAAGLHPSHDVILMWFMSEDLACEAMGVVAASHHITSGGPGCRCASWGLPHHLPPHPDLRQDLGQQRIRAQPTCWVHATKVLNVFDSMGVHSLS
jgi:hypothetical protein